METYMLRYHPAEVTPAGRRLLTGFIAGALSVLIFHQGAIAAMNVLDFTHRPLYSTTATAPWGVPAIWSLAFWGGLWGLVFAAFFMPLWGGALVLAGMAFGAFVLSIVAWFVVAPIKGQPIAAGGVPMAMAAAMCCGAAMTECCATGLAKATADLPAISPTSMTTPGRSGRSPQRATSTVTGATTYSGKATPGR